MEKHVSSGCVIIMQVLIGQQYNPISIPLKSMNAIPDYRGISNVVDSVSV